MGLAKSIRTAGRARRDERGVVLPTRLMVRSISVVALAGLVFVATQPEDVPDTATQVAATPGTKSDPSPSEAPTTTVPAPTVTTPKAPPEIRRARYFVAIFNNSNVQGLAGKTGTRAERAGWRVVGTDNWYGTVDASTVYYGPRMKAAGELLAEDLDIARVKPAIEPMRFDRLTVILTGDYR